MPFSAQEKALLLSVKGVGPKVIQRLEEMGFSTFENLAEANPKEITAWISDELGSTCWKNSSFALAAIKAAITMAQKHSK